MKKEILMNILYPCFPVALDNPIYISRETVTILCNCKDFMACMLNTTRRLTSLENNRKNIEFFTVFHEVVLKDEN